MSMNLIYVNPGNSSVMNAQVLSLLDHYKQMGVLKDIILLQGFKNSEEKKQLQIKIIDTELKVIWFKTYYEYSVFTPLIYNSLKKVLNKLINHYTTILHVRGELYGSIIQKYLNNNGSKAKLLVDVRGLVFEEINYYSTNILLKKYKIKLFKNSLKSLREHNIITVVSKAFKEYLIKYHNFQSNNIVVHPNIADKQFTFSSNLRNRVRRELLLNKNDIVAICSSGGENAWQKDQIVINSLLNLNIKVINLSTNFVATPGVINKIVPFELMPSYLSAADIAILWRDKNIINEVASPSKFSEFACMGLFIIHNDTVKLASDFISNTSNGLIVPSPNKISLQNIKMLTPEERDKSSKIGRQLFGVENIALSYLNIYSRL